MPCLAERCRCAGTLSQPSLAGGVLHAWVTRSAAGAGQRRPNIIFRRKAENGAWTDDTHWNHVVVFSEATRKFIDEQVAKGSLIVARGRIRQSN